MRRFKPSHPCPLCGRPCWGRQCRPCTDQARGPRTDRRDLHNDDRERARRAAAVAEYRATVGNWCPGWGVPAHDATDLCADHPVAVAAGGERSPSGYAILCRRCNSRKGARTQAPRTELTW